MKRHQRIITACLICTGFALSFAGRTFAEDITISSDIAWQPGAYTYDNVLVTNGATLTFNGAVTLNAQNLIIGSNSSISADGKGYQAGQGPGTPPPWFVHLNWAAGAGYGGKGGIGRGGIPGGSTYGSATVPVDLGSGAGSVTELGVIRGNSPGGGAIKLIVQNTLTNMGSITVNGENSTDYYAGGGSGGSVYIIANSLNGSGLISANGGAGNDHTAGGGGGGRIAVYYQTSSFTGKTESKGGIGFGNGEDGTVVFIDTQNNILYSGHSFRFQENDSPFNFSKVILDNSKVASEGNVSLSTDNLTIKNSSDFKLGGQTSIATVNNSLDINANSSLVLKDSLKITVGDSLKLNTASSLNFTGAQSLSVPSLTVKGGSAVTFSGNEILSINNITLSDNSILTHIPEGKLYLDVVNMSIDSTSFLSANNKGNRPGFGLGTPPPWFVHPNWAAGAGYGGKGGIGRGGIPGGTTYGSDVAPVDLGSGAGYDPNNDGVLIGSYGGGLVRLIVRGMLTLGGNIIANGESSSYYYAGGGSGGSVYIITNSLIGSGLISANGGAGNDHTAGGGGGGRIAVYYQTSSFTGKTEAKGGVGFGNGEDGTAVFQSLTLDSSPFTFFNLSEKSSTISTITETLSSQKAGLNNVMVTGDLNGTLNFTNLEFVTIATGAFANKGFSEGEFEAVIENIQYRGYWKGMVYSVPSEACQDKLFAHYKKIYLKGKVSGKLNGIVEGTLTESTPDSGVYDKYEAAWKLNQVGTDTVSATINLEGSLTYQPPHTFISDLYVYQANMEGDAYGSYIGPLSAVLTHLRLTGENEYKGKGFSIISYNTALSQGEGWSYNQIMGDRIDFQGLFNDPLLGKLSALLDETLTPKTLSGTIERLDLGLAPAPDLKVKVWGSTRVSPGQTFDYIIEYRNDGLKAAEDVAIFNILDSIVEHISASVGSYYNDVMDTVNWNLGKIIPKKKGYLNVKVKVPWGLPQGINLINSAYIADVSLQGPKVVLQPCQTNLFLNGIGYQSNDKAYKKKCKEFAESRDRSRDTVWIEVYKDLGNNKASAVYNGAMDTLDALHDIASDTNGLRNPEIVGGRCYNTCYAYSGGTATVITAIINHNLKCNNLELISPFSTGRTADEALALFKRDLELHLMGRGEVKNITIYQGQNDNLLDLRNISPSFPPISLPTGIFQVKFPEGESMQGVKIVRNDTVRHVEWLQYLNNRDKPNAQSLQTQQVFLARDPNELLVSPEGDVRPGDKLNYTINYENEGDGDAYGVYITDTLEEDLDDTTLVVNDGGKYNPATRTISWFIGELLSKQKGSVTFSVNVKQDAQDKQEVINFATVYFPSVPETTRSNGTVNGITAYIDNVAPVTTAAVSPLPNSAGWNNSDVTVTLSAVDNEGGSGVAKTEYSFDNTNWTIYVAPFTIADEGITTVYYKSIDNLNNIESAKSLEVKIDKTPPTIATQTSPQPNPSGWNNSDVTVSFTAADTLSGVSTFTQPQTITTEGKDQIMGGEAVDIAGNRAAIDVHINIDKTPPTINALSSPPPNPAGWNNADVTVSFAGEDSLSGIKTLTAPIVVTTEGQAQEKTGEAIDFADNKAATSVILNIDKTPPELLLELRPINLSEEDDEEADDEGNWSELVYSATDVLSGLKSLESGLAVISLTGFNPELEVDKELEIKINENKRELEIKAPNPQSTLEDLKDALFNLNTNQILQLKVKQGDPKWKLKQKTPGFELQAPSIIFKAIASDIADNTVVKELEFRKENQEDED